MSKHHVDIGGLVDVGTASARLWLLVLLCFFVVAAEGMDVAIMGFVTPSILQQWQVSRAALGGVMGAAPIGLVVEALLAGLLADRYGRKLVLTVSVFLFGLLTVVASLCQSLSSLAGAGFLAGLAMRAAMPNVLTLLSEYAPGRIRAMAVTIMFTGFNLGSAKIGFAAG